MKKVITICFVLLFPLLGLMAQNTFQPKQVVSNNVGIVYDKEFTFDIRLHTHGLALGVNIGRLKTFYKTRFYQFEIGELRHPKEERESNENPNFGGRSSRSFFFGKQNSLYVLRGGIGEKRYFSEKAKERGLAIGISYVVGPSIGLLKPYYLDLIRSGVDNTPEISSEKFSEENAERFLDVRNIFGSSGFSRGISELSILPGIHAKAGVHFDWGAFDEFVKAIEAGVMIDAYFKKVPIMVETDEINNAENRPFFINLYLTLQLGKRW